jgi:hypothetical protein
MTTIAWIVLVAGLLSVVAVFVAVKLLRALLLALRHQRSS